MCIEKCNENAKDDNEPKLYWDIAIEPVQNQ